MEEIGQTLSQNQNTETSLIGDEENPKKEPDTSFIPLKKKFDARYLSPRTTVSNPSSKTSEGVYNAAK